MGAGTVDPLFERVNNLERERKELLAEVTALRSGRTSGRHVSESSTSTSGRCVSEGDFSELEASTSGGSAERSDDMAHSVAVMSLTYVSLLRKRKEISHIFHRIHHFLYET